MEGKGSTRIDVILANPKAASSIEKFTDRWALVEEAHVPLQMDVYLDVLNDDEVTQKTAGTIECNVDLKK